MRTVGLVTTARSDWGILRPVAAALRARDDVQLKIIAGGMHLSPSFGHTVDAIVAEGFEVDYRLDYLRAGDSPAAVAESMGAGVAAFAGLFARWRPDVLLVTADRFDMFPAAVAATPFLIPLAHLHGGEETRGAVDDVLRHALTKLCHLHLAATEAYARRIRQMGEPAEHVHVVGAPGLDDIVTLQPVEAERLHEEFGFAAGAVNILVVYHPETHAYGRAGEDVAELLKALEPREANLVIASPNADTGHQAIVDAIERFRTRRRAARVVTHVPRRTFLSLMRAASVLVGNSSAGLWEAPSFRLPVVNIGERQAGRVRAANVIDCAPRAEAIAAAVQRALSAEFVKSLDGLVNPYGDGHSAPRIAHILATTPLGPDVLCKPFVGL
jgi:UDP-hydrolysing UDP-N-acetyl-D-glucosamine 2-epimerase